MTDERLRPTAEPRLAPRAARRWLADGGSAGHRRVEGTLLFADISGYTRLSERLASKGRAGAEEAVLLISSVLGAIIVAIEERDGDILDFAGDAVVALFDGEDSAALGLAAASLIRQSLEARGTESTSVGRVTLRVAVSVATGPVDLVLAGEAAMGLFAAGPTTTRLVLLERAAAGGDVVICPTTAQAAGGARRMAVRGGGHLLPRSHPAARAQPPVRRPGESPDDDPRLVPASVREVLRASGFDREGDHRIATMAFLVAGGIDDRLTQEPASVAEDLDALYRMTAATADRHGVTLLTTDVAADGVALFLAAGAPLTSGNDEERMLRTLRAVMSSPVAERLNLRAGTHRGPVFAGVVGAARRATYSAMGDTTNVAARLAFRAQPGELLATADVLDRSATEFEAEPAEGFRPKGKSLTITPYRVGRERLGGVRTIDRLPLVGRERELGVLRQRLDAALAGIGSVVHLAGAAGVGKSRLAGEVLADERISSRLAVRFAVGDEGSPYAGLQRALRDLAGLGDSTDAAPFVDWVEKVLPEEVLPEVTPWLPLLGVVFAVVVPETSATENLAPRFRRRRLHDLVGTLLAAVLPLGSVVLVEDLHWSDEASRALLGDLAARAADQGWLVLALSRDRATALDTTVQETLEVGELPPEAVTELALAATADWPLSDAQLRAIVERGAGNPLFIRELATATAASAEGVEDLPDQLEQLLAVRIDRLETSDRSLLRRAAVLGRTVDLDLLAEVLPEVDDVRDPDRWSRLEEFVEPSGADQVRYRHDLYAQAAYTGLSDRVRRGLHASVAAAIERRAGEDVEAVAATLARHHASAGNASEAFRYGRLAGDLARAQVATVDAVSLYRRALTAGTEADVPPRDLAGVAEALGDLAELVGRYDEAMAAYAVARRLLRRAGAGVASSSEVAGLMRKSGLVCERTGAYRQALGWYTKAARALGEIPRSEAARTRLLLDRAGVRQRQGRPADAVALARAAAQSAERLGEQALLAHAYYLLHAAYGDLGSREAMAYRHLALPIYEELGDLAGQGNVLNNLGVDAYYEGRWREALEFYRRSGEARSRLGDVTNAATETNNLAEILSDQGRFAEARDLFTKTLRIWKAAGYEIGVALVTSNLGRLAAREGRPDEGLPLLAEALTRFQTLGASYFVQETSSRLAECHVLAGRIDEAEEVASAALERVRGDADESQLVPALERSLGWCAILRGDVLEAATHFREGLSRARAGEARFEIALSAHALLALPPDLLPDTERAELCAEARDLLAELDVITVVEPTH